MSPLVIKICKLYPRFAGLSPVGLLSSLENPGKEVILHGDESSNLEDFSRGGNFKEGRQIITINEPVDFIERAVMIFLRAKPLRGPLEGAGPENRDCFGP